MTVRAAAPRPLTWEQVAHFAYNAGFRGEALAVIVAIAYGESTHDAHAVGDDTREKVGPKWEVNEQSTGLWQVHYRPSRDRGNPARDPAKNLDPAHNAATAYSLSRGGARFSDWTVFNDGLHKQYLERARVAAAAVTAAPSAAPSAAPPASSAAPAPALIQRRTPTPPIYLGDRLLTGAIGERLVAGEIDLTAGEVSQLKLEFADRFLDLTREHRIDIGTDIRFLDLDWEVTAIETTQGPAHAHLSVVCHSMGAVWMKTTVPAHEKNQSPTGYLERICKQLGFKGFRGEPSAARPTIGPIQLDEEGAKRTETSWEVAQRLADELGFVAFESAGVFHFGRPSWLIDTGDKYVLEWRGDDFGVAPGHIEALEVPRTSQVMGYPHGNPEKSSVSASVLRSVGEQLRPGNGIEVRGIPAFRSGGLMLTQVTWDLRDLHSPVSISAEIPEFVAPTQPVQPLDPGVRQTAPASSGGSSGPNALDFVTLCLKQLGESYRLGAEVDLKNPDPAGPWDCSELVEWACFQLGVQPKFPDYSGNQIDACRPITVEEASKTRGALLWFPGHIVVSLGTGNATIEARGSKYGVVQHTIAGRGFKRGGLIPGMNYGPKGQTIAEREQQEAWT